MLKKLRKHRVLTIAAAFFLTALLFSSLAGPPSVSAGITYNCCRDGQNCSCVGGFEFGAETCLLVFCVCFQQGICIQGR